LGVDAGPLVAAQRRQFAEALAALAVAPEPDDPVALWRHHSGAAVGAFLDALAAGGASATIPRSPGADAG
ncbi:MAG TPA: hypothetical protein VGJ43_04735, partial [Acidimicrobiales bacterium]